MAKGLPGYPESVVEKVSQGSLRRLAKTES